MSRDEISSKTTECQVLIDAPADGAWNMAVDETLLASVADSDVPILRFYQWKQPTLSLGYFQQAAHRDSHVSSVSADLVRRLSGGGAILHDNELTYSLIIPPTHPLSADTQDLYDCVHQAIVRELAVLLPRSQGHLSLCDTPSQLTAAEEPFLCFQRRSAGDIVWRAENHVGNRNDHKVVGSAQRRRRGTILQHGSILLQTSPLTPELPGITELTQQPIQAMDLAESLQATLAGVLGFEFTRHEISSELVAQAQQLRQSKYVDSAWTKRR